MSDSTAANDGKTHPKATVSPATAHPSPSHHVLAHAQPAAGFPVGTVLLVVVALIVGLSVGLLLRRRPSARRAGVPGGGMPIAPRYPQPDPRPSDPRPRDPSPAYAPPAYAPPVQQRPVDREPAVNPERITVSLAGEQAERDALVSACIRARDMSSGSIRRILGEALAQAGVVEVDPTGQPFDPDRHCSVGLLHTPSSQLDATVASSERVGYDDRGRHLRQPEVIVFTSEQAP
jgi:molecular chaperone GrpE